MRTVIAVLLFLALACAAWSATETWKNVPIVDAMCGASVKNNPDAHTAGCLQGCGKSSGVGLLTAGGQFLKFDPQGSKTALTLIEKSKKKDHIRATVTGERAGDTITVKSINLE